MVESTEIATFQKRVTDPGFILAASLGLIAGVDIDVKFGHSPDTAASRTDVWEHAATQPTFIYPADAGEGMTLVSDNPADTQNIEILRLDENGTPKDAELHALNGTIPVPLAGLGRLVIHAQNRSATEFIGAVTIQGDGGISTNVFAKLGLDDQKTSQAIYLVPAGKVAMIVNYSTAINKTAGVSVSVLFGYRVAKPGEVFVTDIRYGLEQDGTSNISSDLIVPAFHGPLCKIKVSATPSSASTDISAEFSIILIDEDLVPPALLASLQ